MLQMLIDNFQVRSDHSTRYYKYAFFGLEKWTGFIYACECSKKIEIVKLLIENFPSIVNQMGNYRKTGFILACEKNNINIVKLLL